MKRILVLTLAVMLVITSACGAASKVPDGFVDNTFCDLTFAVPENWEPMENVSDSESYISYSYLEGEDYEIPLTITAYDAVSTMTDMALMDMMVMGEIDPEETKTDKLERWGRMQLQIYTIQKVEPCEISGADAIRFDVAASNGYEGIHYYVLTDEYYSHFEFYDNGPEITDGFSETISQVMDSLRITSQK